MDYVCPKIKVVKIDYSQMLSSSEVETTPEEIMRSSMFDMERMDIFKKTLPQGRSNIQYHDYKIAYKVQKDKTVVSIQSDSFRKDSPICKGILHNVYIIPVADHGTLISTSDFSYDDILKVNDKVFSKPEKYQHLLKVLYNSQKSLFSEYYFTAESKDRIYLNTYISAPYKDYVLEGKLSDEILEKICRYAHFALSFADECGSFGSENFSFLKDFALPALSVTAKVCAISDVDWGQVIDFGNSDISVDSSDSSFDGGNTSNGQISFTGTEADHNGNPCSVDGCDCTSCYSGNWDPQHCNHCHHLCSKHV